MEHFRNRAIRNGILSMAQAMLTILVYFLVMQQVAIVVGLEAIGLWSISMSLVAFARMLDVAGTGVLARLVATAFESDLRQAQLIDSATIASTFGFGVLAVVGYFAFKPILFASIDTELYADAAALLVGLLLLLPLNAVALLHLGALDGAGRADIRAYIAIIALAISAAATFLLVRRHGVVSLVYAQFLQHGFTLICARILLIRLVPSLKIYPSNFCRERFLETSSFGLRMQVAAIPMAIFDPICRLLIGRVVGLELLGIYELTAKFAASSRLIVQSFANTIVPEFARLIGFDQPAAKAMFRNRDALVTTLALLSTMAQIAALPILSFLTLERIEPKFLIVGGALSYAWGISCIGLTSQLYARAAGVVRHAIVGQWSLLMAGIAALAIASLSENPLWILTAPAYAIILGHLLAYGRELRYFGLQPYGFHRNPIMLVLIFILSLFTAIFILISVLEAPLIEIASQQLFTS